MPVIETDALLLEIDNSGAVRRFSIEGAAWVRPQPAARPVVELTVRRDHGPDQIATLSNLDVTAEGSAVVIACAAVETSDGQRHDVRVRVEASVVDAEIWWSCTVDNRSVDLDVTAVTLPRLDEIGPEAGARDHVLYLPFAAGERLPDPAMALKRLADGSLTGVARGRERVHVRDDRYVYELPYNGGASMTWMCLTAEDRSLYLASHDPEFRVTVLRADTPTTATGRVSLGLTKWVLIRPRQSWSSAPLVTSAVAGDWHVCANLFREWIDSVLDAAGDPQADWCRAEPGLWMAFMKAQDGRVARTYADLPNALTDAASSHVRVLAPFGWSLGGFDTQVPDFYPDPELGGPVRMRRAHQDIAHRGGAIMTYLNGRLMNADRTGALTGRLGVRDASGELVHETYGDREFIVMCPGAPEWRDILADLSEHMVGHYETSLVYLDQVALAPPLACHATHHDHANPDEWNQANRRMLAQVAAQCRALAPDTALSIEGCSDYYASLASLQSDIVLINSGDTYAFPELFKYTFPSAILADLLYDPCTPEESVFSLGLDISREVALRRLRHAILLGTCLGVLDAGGGVSPWLSEVEPLLALRKAVGDRLASSAFRDDLDVVSSSEGLTVKAHLHAAAAGDELLVGVANDLADAPQLVVLHDRWGLQPVVLREITVCEGLSEPRALQRSEGRIEFDVAATGLSFWLLAPQ